MKPPVFGAVVAVLAVTAAVLLLAGRPPAPVRAEPPPVARQVTVTGEGVVHLKPDLATVQLGVRSEGATARDAEALNAAALEKVMAALVNLGVAPEDIRPGRGEMHAMVAQDMLNPGRITGYHADSRLLVTVRNLKQLNGVRETALAHGATDVYGTTYGFTEPEKAKQAAIRAAMDNAEERALALGNAGGVKPKALVGAQAEIVEEPAGPGPAFGGDMIVRAKVTATFQLQ